MLSNYTRSETRFFLSLKITKSGRYGPETSDFDYSPNTIRKSLERSLRRLNTDYLDTIYLHDIEFVASPIDPEDATGDPKLALTDSEVAKQWGLDEENKGKIRGAGDQLIVDAYGELRKMRNEGLVKSIGITGV